MDQKGFQTLRGMKKFDEVVIQKTKAIANTRAAICCTPPKEARNLRVNLGDTFKSSLKLFAADGKKLQIKGCIPVLISRTTQDGRQTKIHEILYFINGLEKNFLSKDTLINLGSISEDDSILRRDNKVRTFKKS